MRRVGTPGWLASNLTAWRLQLTTWNRRTGGEPAPEGGAEAGQEDERPEALSGGGKDAPAAPPRASAFGAYLVGLLPSLVALLTVGTPARADSRHEPLRSSPQPAQADPYATLRFTAERRGDQWPRKGSSSTLSGQPLLRRRHDGRPIGQPSWQRGRRRRVRLRHKVRPARADPLQSPRPHPVPVVAPLLSTFTLEETP